MSVKIYLNFLHYPWAVFAVGFLFYCFYRSGEVMWWSQWGEDEGQTQYGHVDSRVAYFSLSAPGRSVGMSANSLWHRSDTLTDSQIEGEGERKRLWGRLKICLVNSIHIYFLDILFGFEIFPLSKTAPVIYLMHSVNKEWAGHRLCNSFTEVWPLARNQIFNFTKH